MNTTDSDPQAIPHTETETETETDDSRSTRRHGQLLCRPYHDRMLAGVAAGIADYLGADVLIVRIALAVLAVVGGAGVPIYLAGWLLIPEEGAEQSIASELIQSVSAQWR